MSARELLDELCSGRSDRSRASTRGFGHKMEMDSNHFLVSKAFQINIKSLCYILILFLLFLLSAEGNDEFPSPGSYRDEVFVLSLGMGVPWPHHPGENTALGVGGWSACPRALQHWSLSFLFAMRGSTPHFLPLAPIWKLLTFPRML